MPPSSMVCPDCRNLISTEEKKCPYCGAYRPGLWGLGPALSRLFGSRIDVLTLIPTACVTLYVLSLLLDLDAALTLTGGFFNMLSPGRFPMIALGLTYGNAPWWTLFTAIYLHGGLFHILFNVLWIRQLGPEVGKLYGPTRYFIIFTTGGVVGFLLSNAVSGYPTLGASGSIFGLLAALIVYGRSQKTNLATLMTRQVWQWAIMLFIFGFLVQGVNNWAHFGGFGGGWLASRLLVSNARWREGRLTVVVALLLLLITGAGFALSLYDALWGL